MSDMTRSSDQNGATRRQVLRNGLILGASVAAAPLLSACGGDSSPSATTGSSTILAAGGPPRRGGRLVYAWQYQPGNVLTPGDPRAYGLGDSFVQWQLYAQLTDLDPRTNRVAPGLASGWELSRDGRTATFALREAGFSNGRPIRAQDVVYSIARFRNPRTNPNYSFLGAAIDRVRALDERTVRITLRFPQVAILDYLGVASASIVPAGALDGAGARRFENDPVTSGPFAVEERERGRSIVLGRNPGYWDAEKPYLDQISIEHVADDNARLLRITSGDAQVVSSVPFSQLQRIESADGVHLLVEQVGALANVWMTNRHRALPDRDVRLALNLATPRDAIRASVFDGRVDVANSHHPRLRYHDDSIAPYPYDLEAARAAMARSSFPDGFEAEYLLIGSDNDSRQIASILQDSWAQIGVRLNLQQLDAGTFSDRRLRGDYDFLAGPPDDLQSDVAVDDEFASFIYAPKLQGPATAQIAVYDDPQALALVQRATTATEETERARLFSELQRYGMEVNPPWIPLAFTVQRTAIRDGVHGFKTLLNGSWRLEDVWLSGGG